MTEDEVLVLDSQGPNGLALCRTLGKRGLSVTAGGYTEYLPGMLSKYTEGSYVHPHPQDDESAFVEHLEAHLEEREYSAVFPVTDLTTGLLSRHKARLEETGTAIGAETWQTFLSANDKGRLFQAIDDVDVPIPRTDTPSSIRDVETIDASRTYKAVIKPRMTTLTNGTGRSYTNRISATNYVEVDDCLVTRYEALLEANQHLESMLPIVQEYIEGVETMATVGIANEGDLLTTFQHKKYRVYPPSGGIGAVRQGVRERRMRRYAKQIVRALGWTGPIHVEFMKTHDGEFYPLEVNGRYWGSLALTINSGVDIPWYHYRLLTGTEPSSYPTDYRTDILQRKLFYQDLRWLRYQLSEGNLRALVPFMTSFVTTRDEFLDPTDPLPFIGLVPRSLRGLRNHLRGQAEF